MKRVKQEFTGDKQQGVSRDDYIKFFCFLRHINDVDTALSFYHIAGASIDPGKIHSRQLQVSFFIQIKNTHILSYCCMSDWLCDDIFRHVRVSFINSLRKTPSLCTIKKHSINTYQFCYVLLKFSITKVQYESCVIFIIIIIHFGIQEEKNINFHHLKKYQGFPGLLKCSRSIII